MVLLLLPAVAYAPIALTRSGAAAAGAWQWSKLAVTPNARHAVAPVCSVTADEVESAVAEAERLWAEALAAREKADRLSAEAEESSGAVVSDAEAASAGLETLNEVPKFSLSMLSDAQAALESSVHAGGLLSDAVDAAEEADRLEAEAELALAHSEELLRQHLEEIGEAEEEDDEEG